MSDNEFDEFLAKEVKARSVSANQALSYVFSAVAASVAPIYLYAALFNMHGEDYYPVFAIAGLVTVALLCVSYSNIFRNVDSRLSSERRGQVTLSMVPGKTKEEKKKAFDELEKHQDAVTLRESLTFSIIYNNLFYLMGVVVLGFFFLRSIPSTYNFALATIVSAGLVLLSSRA